MPPDCEGWEDLYAPYIRFGESRRPFEEGRFWFQDALHAPEPLYPFDAFAYMSASVAINQTSARLFAQPTSGAEMRILNGYVYVQRESSHRRRDPCATSGAVPSAAATTTSTGRALRGWVER